MLQSYVFLRKFSNFLSYFIVNTIIGKILNAKACSLSNKKKFHNSH